MTNLLSPDRLERLPDGGLALVGDMEAAYPDHEKNAEAIKEALTRTPVVPYKFDFSEKCIVCGRPLRDPVSIARRMGPVCYRKFQGSAPAHFNLYQQDLFTVPEVLTPALHGGTLPVFPRREPRFTAIEEAQA